MNISANRSLSRRNLLRGGAALAASSLLPNPASALAGPEAAMHVSPVKLGIASYTFRKFDTAHLIDFAKQLKIMNLNLKDMHLPMTPADQVAKLAADYRAAGFNLTAAGTISFPTYDEADARAKFEYLKSAGINVMVCMPAKDVLPKLEKFAKEYDIRMAIHNHGPEDKNFPSPFDVLAAVKDMHPNVGLCIDLGHAMRAGADVVAAVKAAGPRLFDVHIKDLAQHDVKESQVAVGEGVMPVREIFKALIDMKYKGDVDLEYEIHEDNPMPGVIESFAYMRGVLAGMGYKG
jgi:sugar phosphate isomerase/epimerase